MTPDTLVAAVRARLDDRRERKRLFKPWRRECKGRVWVISDQMDPDFIPPSTSLNPDAPLARGLGIDPEETP